MQEENIVSISTPLGKGAIAVVRMSGEGALQTALKLFHCKDLTKECIQPRFMYLGNLQLEEDVFEQCLMVYFKAPFSYTGEDVIEFQVHGGVLLAQKVVEVCIKAGARLAEAGEFSKRAFLNGKITLDKAEAIIGEINADAEGELRSSLQVTNGKLAEKISCEQSELTTLLAELEVGMDYPDETEETALKSDVHKKLQEIADENAKILQVAESGKYLKNGINVALVGKTNVGKSSVMNALLGTNRAIVTNIQGTTRDCVSESFVFEGVKINLVDTAGIRQTEDVVESLGIERSKESLKNADLVLFVLDGSENLAPEDIEIEKLLDGKNHIIVINKTDKKRVLSKKENEIEISAMQGKNINLLKQRVLDMVLSEKIDFNNLVLTNERQTQILSDAQAILNELLSTKSPTLDVLSMQIKKVWLTLGKITGNTENEDIINLIFSKFCLGK